MKRSSPDPSVNDSELQDKLSRFAHLVETTAIPLGLVGFTASQIEIEIARSLLLREVAGSPRTLIDVGSGAGFPAVPLAMALRVRVSLIEPHRKAAGFLELALRELELPGEVVVSTASEASGGALWESADVVTARALAPFVRAATWCAPFCRVGGKVILTSGERAALALDAALPAETGLSEPSLVILGNGSDPLEIQQRVIIMTKSSSLTSS